VQRLPNSPGGLADLATQLTDDRRAETLAHRSWAPSRDRSYERLEFLGDTVLSLVVTQELLRRHPTASEGDLAWMRQQIVGREPCAEVADALDLPAAFVGSAPRRLRTTAEEMAQQVSVRAALIEALIGACWLDAEEPATSAAVLAAFAPIIDRARLGQRDSKTALQEAAAQVHLDVRYELVGREGPAHARTFSTRVLVGGDPAGEGTGSSKQASEQAAATAALERWSDLGAAGMPSDRPVHADRTE